MKPIDIYKKGLQDGIDFCIRCIRDMPLSDAYVRDIFNVTADSLERNFKEILKEYDLDHSAAKEKRGN